MARIELTNVTAGGGGGSTTLGLTTTGTSGASLLSAIPGGYILNIPVYQGALTLTTTGSGAATLVGNTLNIPTPTSSTAAGSTGEVQYNGGSGAFAASPNLFWAAGTNRLGIGTSSPAQTLEVSGAMRLTGTAGTADFMLGRSSAGDVSTVTLGTTGTSGAATLSANVLNIPQYQGALTLSTAGTTGASTLVGNTLTIPTYQGQITLTTTGTSGAATLVGNTLNIPQYSGGGGTPAGSTGQIQFNNAGAFGASANLAWDNSASYQLNIGAPLSPTGRINVKGTGTLTTVNTRLTDSSNTELLKVLDNGSTNIGTAFNWDNVNSRLAVGPISTASQRVQISGSSGQTPGLRILNSGVTIPNLSAVGYSPAITTTTVAMIEQAGSSDGGISINGFSATTGGIQPLFFTGVHGVTSPGTVASCLFRGFKWNGTTGITAVTSDEIVAEFSAGNTAVFDIRGNGNVNIGSKFTPSARLQVRGANTTAAVGTFIVEDGAATPATIYRIDNDGKVTYRATNTAAGTTGPQTINQPSGTVNFAAGATSLVVTNSLCTTASIVLPVIRTNDTTATIKNVVPGSGSFTINLSAAATAETSVGFFIIN